MMRKAEHHRPQRHQPSLFDEETPLELEFLLRLRPESSHSRRRSPVVAEAVAEEVEAVAMHKRFPWQ